MGRSRAFWNSVRDFVVLCVILATVNYLLDRADPGWLKLNPTPWLLPAALIGARYGFVGGLVSGLAVAAGLAGVNTHLSGLPLNEVLRENAYFILSIIVVGVVAGEIGTLLGQRSTSVKLANKQLEDENVRLRSQLHIVDETRHQLQQQLALFNAPMCALDAELNALFTYPQEEFAQQLLRSLHRLTGLTSAGIYVVEGNLLQQTTVLHPTPPLAPTLRLDETPLAQQAVTANALASVPDATELHEGQPFLAAFPWLDHLGRTSVLLIQDMPLESYTLHNLARLELILSWASAIAVLRHTFTASAASDHTVSNQDFLVLLGEASEAERIHSLPSALLRLELDGGGEVRGALRHLPNSAVATHLPGHDAIAVLLPFSGETEALQLTRDVTTALPGVRAQHYLITGGVAAPDLWASLQQA